MELCKNGMLLVITWLVITQICRKITTMHCTHMLSVSTDGMHVFLKISYLLILGTNLIWKCMKMSIFITKIFSFMENMVKAINNLGSSTIFWFNLLNILTIECHNSKHTNNLYISKCLFSVSLVAIWLVNSISSFYKFLC